MAGIPLSEGVHIGRAMRSASTGLMVASILAAAGAALAGGLNYGVRPGARGIMSPISAASKMRDVSSACNCWKRG